MTVWVDPPRWPAHGRLWSHLISDTSYGELHMFAEAVGIPRRGFEGDHYDIPQERYAEVVAAGAHEIEGTVLARILRDSGLRVPKRKGERPLATWRDPWPHITGPHRVDIIASPLPTPDASTTAAAVFVVDVAHRLLLVRSVARGTWGAPAGGREPGESAAACGARETWEETGLRLDPGVLRPCGYERVSLDPLAHRQARPELWPHRKNHIACFRVDLVDPGPAVAPRLDDVDAAGWFSVPEARARCAGEPWWPLVESLGL
ncbi:MAG TPA: DUF4031 domain-containing protein [Segeticoccus sp.]|uniref:DUF4031 domain-containing protein n=1 Tax=Segeticoccus sp. TaxID=2706531 RepID=UPI002D80EEE1|nr:DUF4031 domain-containing protein [Segeticoccus sp.]HET8600493.1 DUF4031 domain-containing protein [Segeticoccus sp.]